MKSDSWDEARGKKIRKEFFEDSNIKAAYCFCLNLCGKGNLDSDEFKELVSRADKHRIWEYAGIPIWVIPYTILTLGNLSAKGKSSTKPYGFHFIFDKPAKTRVQALWNSSRECRLVKVFSDSGKIIKNRDNPFGVSKINFTRKSSNTDWIKGRLLEKLKLAQ